MEVFALLADAKALGLDTQVLVPMAITYFLLNKTFNKHFETFRAEFQKLIQAINTLEQTHNKRLKRIEEHVGLQSQDADPEK